MAKTYSFAILGGHLGYLGSLFAHEKDGKFLWSHSLLNHGSPLFDSSEAATHDFWDTKNSLPQHAHDVIFGKAA